MALLQRTTDCLFSVHFFVCSVVSLVALTLCAGAQITEYPVTAASSPSAVCKGQDGAMWFTEEASNQLGRILPDGRVQEFAIPSLNAGPGGCVSAFNGTNWSIFLTESRTSKVARFTPVIDPITNLVINGVWAEWVTPLLNSGAGGILQAGDGYLWVMAAKISKIFRFNPLTSLFVSPTYSMTAGSFPHGPTNGPDGNVWFCMIDRNRIARMTLAGVVTEYVMPQLNSRPDTITTAPDGNLYFVEQIGKVGMISLTTFAITQWALPSGAQPVGIAVGADRNLYVTERLGNKIGMLPLGGGAIVEYAVPTPAALLDKIGLGSDGRLWFTEHGASKIGALSINAASLVALNIIPLNPAIALGTKQQFRATGTYSDGSTLDLTSTVAWSSMNTAVATINNQGLATSVAVGSTTVTATSGAVTGSTTLSITPAVLVSLAITPAMPSVPLGMTQQFTATGTFTDGSTQDLTRTVQWSSNATTVATISNVANTAGLASSMGTGSAQIMATSGAISGSTTINVTAAVLPQPWTPNISTGFHLNGPISAFATDATGTTYAASNGTGVLGSTDGINWTYRGAPPEPSIESLAVSDRLWAGTHNGLYYSFDGGVTWAKYTYLPAITVFSIGIDGGRLMLGTDTGVYSCSGALCTKSTVSGEIRTIVVTPAGVIAGSTCGCNGGGVGGDLYRSADRLNWTKIGIPNAWSFRSLTQDSQGNIYAGAYFKTYAAGGIYISQDSGLTWSGPVMPTADVNALSSANGVVYAGLGDGTLWSTPAGQNAWTKQVNPSGKSIRALLYPMIGSDGIYRADFVPVNQPSTAPQVSQVLVAPDGTTYTRSRFFGITNDTTWIGPDGIEDQQSYQGNTMFFNSIGDLIAISGGNLYRWNGVFWVKAKFSIAVAYQLRAHIVLPSGAILVSDTSPNVFRSLDGGTTFTKISRPAQYGLFFSFYYANGVLYAATEGSHIQSLDYGVTWTLLQSGGGGNHYSTIISPSGTLLIGIADTKNLGSVFRYVYGVWSRSNRGIRPGESIYSLVQNGTSLYAVGVLGVYMSTDDGNSWTSTTGLPTFFFTYDALVRPGELTILPSGRMILGIHWEGKGSFVQ